MGANRGLSTHIARFSDMRDEEIFELLSRRAAVPYPGTWPTAPFENRHLGDQVYALVAIDPGLSAIGVDRELGELWLLPEDDESSLINSGIAAFVTCSQVYATAVEEAARLEAEGFSDDDSDEDDSDPGDEFTDALIAQFATIDEPSTADENAFWPIAAEELGYSLPA